MADDSNSSLGVTIGPKDLQDFLNKGSTLNPSTMMRRFKPIMMGPITRSVRSELLKRMLEKKGLQPEEKAYYYLVAQMDKLNPVINPEMEGKIDALSGRAISTMIDTIAGHVRERHGDFSAENPATVTFDDVIGIKAEDIFEKVKAIKDEKIVIPARDEPLFKMNKMKPPSPKP